MTVPLDSDDPKAWLARAQSNLQLAQVGFQPGVFLEDLCFQAQQAAEKAFKAVCLHQKLEFPKTHSLVILIDLLEQSGVHLPPEVREADTLTFYAVQSRYPGWGEVVTEDEYHRVLAAADQVVSWAKVVISGGD